MRFSHLFCSKDHPRTRMNGLPFRIPLSSLLERGDTRSPSLLWEQTTSIQLILSNDIYNGIIRPGFCCVSQENKRERNSAVLLVVGPLPLNLISFGRLMVTIAGQKRKQVHGLNNFHTWSGKCCSDWEICNNYSWFMGHGLLATQHAVFWRRRRCGYLVGTEESCNVTISVAMRQGRLIG